MNIPKFNFYERVKIIKNNINPQAILNSLGTINGRAQNEQGEWNYSVSLDYDQDTWCFDEQDLVSIGIIENPNKLMTDETIKVNSDGNLIDPD